MLLLDFYLFVRFFIEPTQRNSVYVMLDFLLNINVFACFESWTKANSLYFYTWQINDPWILESLNPLQPKSSQWKE